MSIDKAVSSNWIVESFTESGDDISLTGSGVGYSSFERGFNDGDTVPYTLFDDALNREAGYATYQGRKLINRTVKATLVNGIYNENSPAPVNFPNGGTASCTFNAAAFDELWAHLSDKGNPHNTTADLVPLNPAFEPAGENVQVALENIYSQFYKDGDWAGVSWAEVKDKPDQIEVLGVDDVIHGGTY